MCHSNFIIVLLLRLKGCLQFLNDKFVIDVIDFCNLASSRSNRTGFKSESQTFYSFLKSLSHLYSGELKKANFLKSLQYTTSIQQRLVNLPLSGIHDLKY